MMYKFLILCSVIMYSNTIFDYFKDQKYPVQLQTRVEIDEYYQQIKKFKDMKEFKTKQLNDVLKEEEDPSLEVTQQIYVQSQDLKIFHFFQPTKEAIDYVSQNYPHYFSVDLETGNYMYPFLQPKIQNYVSNQSQNFFKNYQKQSLLQVDMKRAVQLPLRQNLFWIQAVKCWASNRYEYAYVFSHWVWYKKWFQNYEKNFKIPYGIKPLDQSIILLTYENYPCAQKPGHKIFYHWHWYSEKMQINPAKPNNFQSTFKLTYSQSMAFSAHYVFFMQKPMKYKVEMSLDDSLWITVMDWVAIPIYWILPFWFHVGIYDPQRLGKYIRIVLFGDLSGTRRHGIYNYGFFGKEEVITIISEGQGVLEKYCIAKSEPTFYKINEFMRALPCLDAIMQQDTRELLVINQTKLMVFMDELCLGTILRGEDKYDLITVPCVSGVDFKFEQNGLISLKRASQQCITVQPNKLQDEIQKNSSLDFSGILSDSRINPYKVIEDSNYQREAYGWIGNPDVSYHWFTLFFDRQYFVNQIIVQWKFKPKHYEVLIYKFGKFFTSEQWVSIANYENDPDMIKEITIFSQEIQGVKILMFEYEEDMFNDFNKKLYGISQIKVKRPGSSLYIETCGNNNEQLSKQWRVEKVDYIFTWVKPILHDKLMRIYQKQNDNKKVLLIFKILKQLISYNKRINDVIQNLEKYVKIEKQLDSKLIQSIKEMIQYEITSENQETVKCLGCSKLSAAGSCNSIKKFYHEKQNGFYWIQNECMSQPLKVFCDFETSKGNFYYYEGTRNGENKQIFDINPQYLQSKCRELGLFPFQITSVEQVKSVIGYLNQINANEDNEFMIPFAHDFSCNKEKCENKFKSFDSPQGKDILNILKELIDQARTQNIEIFRKINKFDTIFLGNSKTNLQFGILKKAQIRGIFYKIGFVCSENKFNSNKDKSDVVYINCNDTFQQIINTNQPNNLKVFCPTSCSFSKLQIYGKTTFSKTSPICKTGIFSGIITNQKGGQFKIQKQICDKTEVGELQNGVNTLSMEKSPEKTECFIIKSVRNLDCSDIIKRQSFLQMDEDNSFDFINDLNSSFLQLQDKILTESYNMTKTKIRDPQADESLIPQEKITMVKVMKIIQDKFYDHYFKIEKLQHFIKDVNKVIRVVSQKIFGIEGSNFNKRNISSLIKNIINKVDDVFLKFTDINKNINTQYKKILLLNEDRKQQIRYLEQFNEFNINYEIKIDSIFDIIDGFFSTRGNFNNFQDLRIGCSKMFIMSNSEKRQQKIVLIFNVSKIYSNPKDTVFPQCFFQKKGNSMIFLFDLTLKKKITELSLLFSGKYSELDIKINSTTLLSRFQTQKYALKRFIKEPFKLKEDIQRKQILIHGKFIKRYNCELKAVKDNIVFKLREEREFNTRYDQLPEIINQNEYSMIQGRAGFYTDNNQAMFDSFYYKALKCVVNEKEPQNEQFLPPKQQSSRYVFDTRNVLVQDFLQNGNAWQTETDILGKKHLLLIKEQNSAKSLILKNVIFQKGYFNFQIYKQSKKANFSLFLFYYNNKNKVELLYKSGKWELNKIIDGNKMLILQLDLNWEVRQWVQIIIQISEEIQVNIKNFRTLDQNSQSCEYPQDVPGVLLGFKSNGPILISDLLIMPIFLMELTKIKAMLDKQTSFDVFNFYPQKEKFPQLQEDPQFFKITEKLKQIELGQQNPNPIKNQNFERAFDQIIQSLNEESKTNQNVYSKCLQFSEPQQIEEYCQNRFQNSLGLKKDCMIHFCQRCCDENLGYHIISEDQELTIKKQCEQKCNNSQKQEDNKSAQFCINSLKPQSSISRFCYKNYEQNAEMKTLCQVNYLSQIDTCQACCVLQPIFQNIFFQTQTILNCQKECLIRYS